MTATPRLFHGGVPGLRPGALLVPGHARRSHPGCAVCAAREQGGAVVVGGVPVDPPTGRPDRVYAAEHRLYARLHASLWGRGDLYRVNPVDPAALEPSPEDPPEFGVWLAPAFVVVAVVDRAVLLTWTERRRLWREWSAADAAKEAP